MNNKKKIMVLVLIILLIVLSLVIYYVIKNYYNNSYNENNKLNTQSEEIEKISEYNNPVVPEGFNKVETETASWKNDENGIPIGWNNGLVIEDEKGNQFVWVPVQINDYDELVKGLYYTVPEDEESGLIPIKKHSGFYVSRYEAGVSEEMQPILSNIGTETNDIEGIPVSKKGVRPWNFITKENAMKNSEKMYSNNYVYSSLLTLKEWLHINTWLETCGYEVKNPVKYGNFSNVNFEFSGLYSDDLGISYIHGNNKIKATKNMILATGISDRNMTNNLYDFYGNVAESTILRSEGKAPDGISTKIYTSFYVQGGYYDNSSIGVEDSFTHAWANSKVGFRVVLYIK